MFSTRSHLLRGAETVDGVSAGPAESEETVVFKGSGSLNSVCRERLSSVLICTCRILVSRPEIFSGERSTLSLWIEESGRGGEVETEREAKSKELPHPKAT